MHSLFDIEDEYLHIEDQINEKLRGPRHKLNLTDNGTGCGWINQIVDHYYKEFIAPLTASMREFVQDPEVEKCYNVIGMLRASHEALCDLVTIMAGSSVFDVWAANMARHRIIGPIIDRQLFWNDDWLKILLCCYSERDSSSENISTILLSVIRALAHIPDQPGDYHE